MSAMSMPGHDRNADHSNSRRTSSPWMDVAFRGVTRFFALLVFSLLAAILLSLIWGSSLSLEKFGPSFLWSNEWDPVKEEFGALVPIYGTLVTSLIAMLIGVPVSFGIAIFLTELCPGWLKRPLGTAIELLAGIPSIISAAAHRHAGQAAYSRPAVRRSATGHRHAHRRTDPVGDGDPLHHRGDARCV